MIIKIEKKDFHLHPFLSPLLDIPDCPSQLYYRGTIPEKNNHTKVLCVIGSRKGTNYGREATNYLISGLAGYPIIVVSGLALGIDTQAHKASLLHHMTTVSFPGSGLDPSVLYPKTNLHLAEEIVDNDGCLISEYSPETKSALYTFPARNRLMAGVADLVLVIEAEEKSGTQITARLALDYNRELAIVPGSIFSSYSRGTAQLYKSGAHPVTSSADILELLGFNQEMNQPSLFEEEKEKLLSQLSEQEKTILNLLDAPLSKDELIELSELPAHEAIIAITNLEAKHYILDSFGEIKKII